MVSGRWPRLSLACVLLAGCDPLGPGPAPVEPAGTTGETDPDAGEPTTGAGSSSASGPGEANPERPPDLPPVCSGFEDATSPGDVPIRITNGSEADLFLLDVDGCNIWRSQYRLRRLGEIVWPKSGCGYFVPCERVVGDVCESAWCHAVCYWAETIRIIPGGSYAIPWEGLVYEPRTLPPECAPGCDFECDQARPAEIGEHLTLELLTATEMECPGGDCACNPNGEGWCVYPGYDEVAHTAHEIDVSFDGGAIDVIIGP